MCGVATQRPPISPLRFHGAAFSSFAVPALQPVEILGARFRVPSYRVQGLANPRSVGVPEHRVQPIRR